MQPTSQYPYYVCIHCPSLSEQNIFSWYGVCPIVTLYVIQYESNIVDKCLSQSVRLSFTSFIHKAMIILVHSLVIVGCRTNMSQYKVFCQMFECIMNEMHP